MRLTQPVSKQLHAGALSLGSLAVAGQAHSLSSSLRLHQPFSLILSQLPTTNPLGHEPLDAKELPSLVAASPARGLHPWTPHQQKRRPGSSLQRFLSNKDDARHAYLNGLADSADQQRLLVAQFEKLDELLHPASRSPSYDHPVRQSPDGVSQVERFATTTSLPIRRGKQPRSTCSSSARSACDESASLASNHSSLDSTPASLSDSEQASVGSSVATGISETRQQDDVVILVVKRNKPTEDHDLSPYSDIAAEPTIPKSHFGDEFECSFALKEVEFEDWVGHIIHGHLGQEPLKRMTCPYCPEELFHGGESTCDEAILRQRLGHLRIHSPWLEACCLWPLYIQYACHQSESVALAPSPPRTPAGLASSSQLPGDNGEQSSKHGPALALATGTASLAADGVRHHGTAPEERASESKTQPTSNSASTPSTLSNGRRTRNRHQNASAEDDSDDESQHIEDGDDQSRSRTETNTPTEFPPKYACPFFKNDHQKYAACGYSGVKNMHGVKKHLSLKHAGEVPAGQCQKCRLIFEQLIDLNTHIQNCDANLGSVEYQSKPSATTTQQDTGSSKTTEDKWRELYRQMFPEDRSVPVPYNWTYEYFLNFPVLDAMQDNADCALSVDCIEAMSQCFPYPMSTVLEQLLGCVLTVACRHMLDKARGLEGKPIHHDIPTSIIVEECQALWGPLCHEWQFNTWFAAQPPLADLDSDVSTVLHDISIGAYGQPFTDSGYGSGPNTEGW